MKMHLPLLLLFAGALCAAPRIVIHGHRGAAAVLPENTLPSFREAIRAGADYIELDLHVSRDNVLIVYHDPEINLSICQGPGGKRPIRELTLAEIKQYDCGSLKPPAFPHQRPSPGARIPTFDEVLELAKSSQVRFNIEIKYNEKWKPAPPPREEFVQMVSAAIRRHKLEDRVLVQSFDFGIVKAMRALEPGFLLAALYGAGARSFPDIARETGAQIVTPQYKLVTPEKVKEAHAAGIQVVPWTVDDAAEWQRLIDAGVDGIITNDPGALAAFLRSKGLR